MGRLRFYSEHGIQERGCFRLVGEAHARRMRLLDDDECVIHNLPGKLILVPRYCRQGSKDATCKEQYDVGRCCSAFATTG